jgi:hypothetical protein
MMQVSAPKARLPLRRARSLQVRPPFVGDRSFQVRSPFVEQRRERPSWRVVGAVAVPLAALAVLALVARRRFFQGMAVVADAVEEAVDVVEDAAEDLADAARERAERAD